MARDSSIPYVLMGGPAFAPYEDPIHFVSGSASAGFAYLGTGTFSHDFLGPLVPMGVEIIDDPPIDPNPPFPGWDPRAQSVQYENEDGVVGLIIRYGQIAICGDLELDPEDFAWRSADIVLAPPGGIPMPAASAKETEDVFRRILRDRLEKAYEEIELLKLQLEGMRTPPIDAVGPPSAPWTGKIYETGKAYKRREPITPKPLVGTWFGDPIFGDVVPGLSLPANDYPAGEHDDLVDAVRLSFDKMILKAVGLSKPLPPPRPLPERDI